MNTFNRNVSKITAATLLAFTLAACGGGGNSGSGKLLSTDSTPTKDNKVFSLLDKKQRINEELEEYGAKLDNYSLKIKGDTYQSENIDLAALGNGVKRVDLTEEAEVTVEGTKGKVVRNSVLHIYQQPYSIVAGIEVKGGKLTIPAHDIEQALDTEDVDFDMVRGSATQTLPTSGKFNYVGEALSQEQTGRLNYTVDFAAKTGSGSISNIAGGITLNEGRIGAMSHTNPDNTSISGHGISSTARSNSGLSGTYKLGFFGPNADEVAGVVTSSHGDVAFGGKKQ